MLQEYFYNDYALIQAVLNDNGMIIGEPEDAKELFPKKYNELELENKKLYKIANKDDENIWNDKDTYIKIYQKPQGNA